MSTSTTVTPFDARARLHDMATAPGMWGATRREFALQALICGELLGSPTLFADVGAELCGPDGGGPVDGEWAVALVGQILDSIPASEPRPEAQRKPRALTISGSDSDGPDLVEELSAALLPYGSIPEGVAGSMVEWVGLLPEIPGGWRLKPALDPAVGHRLLDLLRGAESEQTSRLIIGDFLVGVVTPTSGTTITLHAYAGGWAIDVDFGEGGSAARAADLLARPGWRIDTSREGRAMLAELDGLVERPKLISGHELWCSPTDALPVGLVFVVEVNGPDGSRRKIDVITDFAGDVREFGGVDAEPTPAEAFDATWRTWHGRRPSRWLRSLAVQLSAAWMPGQGAVTLPMAGDHRPSRHLTDAEMRSWWRDGEAERAALHEGPHAG